MMHFQADLCHICAVTLWVVDMQKISKLTDSEYVRYVILLTSLSWQGKFEQFDIKEIDRLN